jgi:hypothetical protein
VSDTALLAVTTTGQLITVKVDANGYLIISNPGGGGEQNVNINQINGNPVSSTNPMPVEVENFPSNQTVSGTVNIGNLPSTQAVSGTVGISNFPADQVVSGTVNIGNYPSVQDTNMYAAAGAIGTNQANGATISANTAFQITFNQQVHHIMIENNTGAPIQFELDATTFAGSMHLSNSSPGNQIMLDIACTNLYILSTANTVYNGTNGVNVRGWL